MLQAVGLVLLVIFVFLQNWRSTLIPTIAVPVSLIGAFAAMAALGFTINTLSLLGLVVAVALVVDDAIVVVENVNRRLDEGGKDLQEVTEQAMIDVRGPIIATTLVLMAVFVPVAFIPGLTGQLYNQFALTIAIAVGISGFNSLTLSPAMCARSLRPRSGGRKNVAFRAFDTRLCEADRRLCGRRQDLRAGVVSDAAGLRRALRAGGLPVPDHPAGLRAQRGPGLSDDPGRAAGCVDHHAHRGGRHAGQRRRARHARRRRDRRGRRLQHRRRHPTAERRHRVHCPGALGPSAPPPRRRRPGSWPPCRRSTTRSPAPA